jgi:hypothetical protein
MSKQKLPMGPGAIKARIMALDTKTMGKMRADEFWTLHERADFEGRKKLDYLMRRMEIESFARGVVLEELAKQNSRKGKKGT